MSVAHAEVNVGCIIFMVSTIPKTVDKGLQLTNYQFIVTFLLQCRPFRTECSVCFSLSHSWHGDHVPVFTCWNELLKRQIWSDWNDRDIRPYHSALLIVIGESNLFTLCVQFRLNAYVSTTTQYLPLSNKILFVVLYIQLEYTSGLKPMGVLS